MRSKSTSIEEVIEKLRPIDDIFFQKLAEQEGFCEELLQIILQNKSLKLLEIKPQKNLRNVIAKSVVLDVLCKDLKNKYYNIEVQRSDDDDHIKRVRYNSANIDTYITEKGIEYKYLPNICIIYISSFDIFEKGKTVYYVEKVLKGTNYIVNYGIDEVYVNAKVDDKSDIADLMKIFVSEVIPNDERFPKICRAIRVLKEKKGSGDMCKLVEEYGEGMQQDLVTVILELRNGASEEELLNEGFTSKTIENAKIALNRLKLGIG
ncbi:MAG: Rpn family recombination-promoting nuclease/putative transposase [Lachnospiraceae bacterium]|nr:Rpn family recombination-promoting nuclease/putative transposase [Lachnospiraceae bacterium]